MCIYCFICLYVPMYVCSTYVYAYIYIYIYGLERAVALGAAATGLSLPSAPTGLCNMYILFYMLVSAYVCT